MVVVKTMNSDQINFDKVYEQAITSMKNLQLPSELQLKINDYLLRTQYKIFHQERHTRFMELLSPYWIKKIN